MAENRALVVAHARLDGEQLAQADQRMKLRGHLIDELAKFGAEAEVDDIHITINGPIGPAKDVGDGAVPAEFTIQEFRALERENKRLLKAVKQLTTDNKGLLDHLDSITEGGEPKAEGV